MKSMQYLTIAVIISFSIVSCSSNADVSATKIAEEIYQTLTAEVPSTDIPTETNTPTETITVIPTDTNTVTVTPTNTITPTPYDVSSCIDLPNHPDNWNLWFTAMTGDKRRSITNPFFDNFNGKCVRFFGGSDIGFTSVDRFYLTVSFDLVIDEFTPVSAADATYIKSSSYVGDRLMLSSYSAAWGIWNVIESGDYEILLRGVEPNPYQQEPIPDDGLFNISAESEYSPGQWKSIRPSEDCYWARLNSSTGNIIQNHLGIGGIYINLQEGDLFESKNCAPWVFVQP